MFRPSTLIMDDDDDDHHFSAPRHMISKESLDCGLSCFGGVTCCNGPGCQKHATASRFITVLILCGLFQGALQEYFRFSANLAADEFEYSETIVDWLLVSVHIFMGVAAVLFAYWGNYFHRGAWLGGLVLLQAIASVMVIVPKLTHTHGSDSIARSDNVSERIIMQPLLDGAPLCTEIKLLKTEGGQFCFSTLIMLFILQFAAALGNVAFFSFGLSYVDDNVEEHDSPALLGAAFASRFWGPQIGSLVSWSISTSSSHWWIGFPPLGAALGVTGILLALFPLKLVTMVVKHAAASILDIATNNENNERVQKKYKADPSFCPSFKRLLGNKVLMLNIFAMVFLLTGLWNFVMWEPYYLQARFYIPVENSFGFYDPWKSRLTSNLLKPPIIALCVLVSGLIISKCKPRARFIAGWNLIVGAIFAALLITTLFFDCTGGRIKDENRGNLLTPVCSSHCICPKGMPFMPVCAANGRDTYFSPCHAGCKTEDRFNNILTFGNCSCGQPDSTTTIATTLNTNPATDVVGESTTIGINNDLVTNPPLLSYSVTVGACHSRDCEFQFGLFQVLSIIAAALLGTGLVGNLVISLRSILPQDKALAIGIELYLVGIIVHVPGKLLYDAIADNTCQYKHAGVCKLHSYDNFGLIMVAITVALVAVSLILDSLVLFYISGMPLYGEDGDDDGRGSYRYGNPNRMVLSEIEMDPILPSNGQMRPENNVDHQEMRTTQSIPYIDDSAASNLVPNHNGRSHDTSATISPVDNHVTQAIIAETGTEEPELNFNERRPSPSPPEAPRVMLNSDL